MVASNTINRDVCCFAVRRRWWAYKRLGMFPLSVQGCVCLSVSMENNTKGHPAPESPWLHALLACLPAARSPTTRLARGTERWL